jgi:esterase/lipase superfamily enzyme
MTLEYAMTFRRHIVGNLLVGVFILLLLLATAGCAPRPGAQALSLVPQGETALQHVTIEVASIRGRDANTGNYSDARAPALSYETFTISIPPTHQATQIEWPKSKPDVQTSFVVTDRKILPNLDMSNNQTGSGHRVAGKRDILIFVHGYNYTFSESLFRLAQVAADGNLEEMPILFAWPSAASVLGYVADKDAVTYSRDDLVKLLVDVAADPAVGKITLFGHSMGCWLVAEALRQLRLSGQDKVINRLENVVLAAPDIDIDVFRRQLQTIGTLNPPITLLVSPDDRALRLSEWLAGSRRRVGTTDANDPRVQALAAAYGVRVIDISKVDAVDASNHNRFAALMKVLPRTTKSIFPSLAHAGAFILEPIGATLVASQK